MAGQGNVCPAIVSTEVDRQTEQYTAPGPSQCECNQTICSAQLSPMRWQINLASLSCCSLVPLAISTLLITVIGHVARLLLSLYLDSTRRLIIIINFNHSTSTLFCNRVQQHCFPCLPACLPCLPHGQIMFTAQGFIQCKFVYFAQRDECKCLPVIPCPVVWNR